MKRKILSLLLLSFILVQAYSQNFISKEIRGERGISKQFISLDDEQLVNFNGAQVKSLLGLNANSDLVLKKTEQDQLGFIHYRYYQTYRSIPIENSMYIIHTKNGALQSLGGAIVTDFDQTIDKRAAQRISGEQAISIAVKYVNAKQYAWQVAGLEQSIKEQFKDAKASYKPTASLVWYSSKESLNPRELRLCYKVDVYARLPLSRAYYFVDALTGNVIGKKDRIQSTDATGTAATKYSGSQTIHSDLFSGSYRLRDYTKGSGIVTRHGESATFGNDYTSASANWSLGGTNIAALDAHYGVSQTYAFYLGVLGRNSYDNLGTTLYSYVNEGDLATFNCDNAYWDGSQMHFLLRCDGNTGGVTGIDVTGHELTHGVTQETSGLIYQDESGAMNESMSDIFGKAVQFWSKPADIDWRLSNDMGWLIRNMKNPNAFSQPDTYHGTYWQFGGGDNGGVHTNSGVGNFMFYLLVTGGSGTNDNGDPYSVTGIGLDHAEKIMYRTNTTYLTSTSQYADWLTASVNAATDLYGAGSNDVTQVQNAWHAVGVGTGGVTCDKPTGLASSNITSTSATVSWAAATGALKYRLQYRDSPLSPWTTVSNIATTSYNITGLTPNTAYSYRVQSFCANKVKSTYSKPKSFTTLPASGYCPIQGSTSFEYIDRVKIGTGLDNISGNNGGYADFTALSKTMGAGTSQNIQLFAGFTGTIYPENWEVYIDYNQDKDFADAGERVGQGTSPDASPYKATISFTVPLTAKNGNTRMRVIMHYGNYLNDPCYPSAFDGEAEDYTVKINGGTLNAAAESDVAALNSIMVSPNPVKGSSASVVVQAAKAGSVNLKIADLSGRILRSENVNSIVAGKNNYSLRNINLLPGTYMIIAQQGNAIIARTQFVVDK